MKKEFQNIGLKLNPEKCELIMDNERETIIDSYNSKENFEIKGVKKCILTLSNYK